MRIAKRLQKMTLPGLRLQVKGNIEKGKSSKISYFQRGISKKPQEEFLPKAETTTPPYNTVTSTQSGFLP